MTRLPAMLGSLVLALTAGLVLTIACAPAVALAGVDVDINQGNIQPAPIAIPAFGGADQKAQELGGDIARVIAGNLERSGYFRPLDPAAMVEKNLDINVLPRFADWKSVSAQYLLNGQVTQDADGRLRVDMRLWSVFNEQQLVGVQFIATNENWRRIAHKISDAVYKQLTGEDGYFDTRIVFVAESGSRGKRVSRLAIMDQDGANPSYLSDGDFIAMTPRFSSNTQQITYTALRQDSSRVYLFNIESARHEVLGASGGMVFAPRFSPDGLKVVYSLSRNGNTDVFVQDLRSGAQSRLTDDPAIDTSPSYAPDGARIVFNSDRGGSPQLYVMDADGSNQHRISFGSGRYTTPVWSPKGDLIAFTKQEGNQFHIGVMKPDGSGERILTTSYLDEGPTWAPNGRVLMFSRETRGGASRLWTVDVSGRNERPSPYPGVATDPAWSPLLK
jgi:TolB protein